MFPAVILFIEIKFIRHSGIYFEMSHYDISIPDNLDIDSEVLNVVAFNKYDG